MVSAAALLSPPFSDAMQRAWKGWEIMPPLGSAFRGPGVRGIQRSLQTCRLERKVSFKLAHLGHMCLVCSRETACTIKQKSRGWNWKKKEVLDERWRVRDFVSPLYIFSLEHKKKMESWRKPLLSCGPGKTCPSFHEQTVECLLLPPDGFFPLISFCSSRCASHCLIPLAHRAL